jgi:hypothetical protein
VPRLTVNAYLLGTPTRQIRLEGATPGLIDTVSQPGLRYGFLIDCISRLVQRAVDIGQAGSAVRARGDQLGGPRRGAKLSDSKRLTAAVTAPPARRRLFIQRGRSGRTWPTSIGSPSRMAPPATAHIVSWYECCRRSLLVSRWAMKS